MKVKQGAESQWPMLLQGSALLLVADAAPFDICHVPASHICVFTVPTKSAVPLLSDKMI